MELPTYISGVSGPTTTLEYKALNIPIFFDNKQFFIPKITCFPNMHGDFIIGTNFLHKYLPFILQSSSIQLRHPTGDVTLPLMTSHKSLCDSAFTPERITPTVIWPIPIKTAITHWLLDLLAPNFSEDPLLWWDKSPRWCNVQLDAPNKIIKVKPILYLKADIEEFDKQIPELLALRLIEPSTSPHSCPAFMVRNHAEIKCGKARMVINYKHLNQNILFDGYFIPRKDILIHHAKQASIYSKFDLKSGFWQLKLTEESKPLTAFSTPFNRHYQWTIMPFGLCTAL
ncbi:uncharacterized protein LOC122663342 [Telopea speciosissima]|uniref:uncharacterized protein LOC122663342 n=1 Tax=Telopea speciosissima TaxID=54955 RepID=UPI001CC34D5D|nr:uncharacterized protein LOC122663342 [Telopea speciosissima]